ncbi:MAG: fused tRNA nucleotidyltransferase/2',3'-cyclic phosphodiesterase/2' nucleotidase and phosphatase [Candidatus Westeberhardia cardiocondylae]|nr:fused tRNA nucleotidyltransferase/2',3'-cyclic phosphodiesterase/2' nucleotidase and phosphatase [Candidatus Westeberhardia cardiocondylae]
MEIYLVGGAVRDTLLKIPVVERDWVVVGSTPQEMLKNGFQQVGRDFPVFLHPNNHEEYALARVDRKYGKRHIDFNCISKDISLEEDLQRRDLTINAIARDKYGNFIDPYNGINDIRLCKLRHVSNAFCEDPLRVLRVARFAARFFHLGFSVDSETLLLMKLMCCELKWISPERVWKETEQALVTKNPHVFFQVLRDCGALEILFPEIHSLFSIPTLTSLQKEINVGVHTLAVMSIVSKLSCDAVVRFSALCHDFGKIFTSKKFWPNHFDHEVLGQRVIEKFCTRLRIPNIFKNFAKITAKYHDFLYTVNRVTSEKLIQFFNDIDIWHHKKKLEKLIVVSEANLLGNIGCNDFYKEKIKFLRKAYEIANLITAKEIIQEGFTGKNISSVLNARRQDLLGKWINIYNIKN